MSYHVVIVTQARTVNALFKKLLYSAYRPLLIVRSTGPDKLGLAQDIPSAVEG